MKCGRGLGSAPLPVVPVRTSRLGFHKAKLVQDSFVCSPGRTTRGCNETKSPSMRRPVGVKSILVCFRWTRVFSLPSRHCHHPSIRSLDERRRLAFSSHLISSLINFRHGSAELSCRIDSFLLEHPSIACLRRLTLGFFVFHHFEFQVAAASTRRSLP